MLDAHLPDDDIVPEWFGNAKDLRIVIVSDAEPERNGVGAYYADLIQHLRVHVAQAELFCPRPRAVDRIGIPMPGDSTQKIWLPRYRKLRREIRAMAPHAIVLPTPGPWGLLGAMIARQTGAAVIVGFHTHFERLTDLYWNRPWSRALGGINRAYLKLANRYLFGCGSLVLANSGAMVDEARACGAAVAELIGTPLPHAYIERPLIPPSLEIKHVLYAGRLAPEKNIGTVIDAASELPDLRFSIVGDGPLRSAFAAAANALPNLEVIGWKPREALLEMFDDVDLLVLPSHVESLGMVALEALARGRSVLVSANCGITEWPDLNEALFRLADDESLARGIERVAGTDRAVRKRKNQCGIDAARRMNDCAVEGWLEVFARQVPRVDT